jgi:hypothetical protein
MWFFQDLPFGLTVIVYRRTGDKIVDVAFEHLPWNIVCRIGSIQDINDHTFELLVMTNHALLNGVYFQHFRYKTFTIEYF